MIITNDPIVFQAVTYTACMLIDGDDAVAVNNVDPNGYIALSCIGRLPTPVYIAIRRYWHPAPLIVNGTLDLPRMVVLPHRKYAVYVAHRVIESNTKAPKKTFYQFGARQYVFHNGAWRLTPLTYLTKRVWREVVRRAPFYHMPPVRHTIHDNGDGV